MLIKIKNMFETEQADYKGLDIEQFIPFSQHYDYETKTCVVNTNEAIDVSNYKDVSLVSVEEYNAFAEKVAEQHKSPEQKRIEELESVTGALLMEMAMLKMGGNI